MTDDATEVLSAFADGEAVDPAELAKALAEAGAREVLLDFLLLRASLVDTPGPEPAFVERTRSQLARRPAGRTRRVIRALATAAVLALAALGVLNVGRWAGEPARDEPPEPTRVIRFEPGVDWHATVR